MRPLALRVGLLLLVPLSGVVVGGCASEPPDPTSSPPVAAEAVDNSPAALVARCLKEQGWDITYEEWNQSIGFVGNKQQIRAYDADYAVCAEKFGEEIIPYSEFTDDMWRELYAEEAERAECLRGLGVDVPEIPSYETFVERYPTDDVWTAYQFLPVTDAATERSFNEQCPQR